MQIKKKILSDNIKALRLRKGLAQERLALNAGIDRTLVSKIERGLGNPTLSILIKLSAQLDVHICELLCETIDSTL